MRQLVHNEWSFYDAMMTTFKSHITTRTIFEQRNNNLSSIDLTPDIYIHYLNDE